MLWPIMSLGVWMAVGAGVVNALLLRLNHSPPAGQAEPRPALAPVPVQERADPGTATESLQSPVSPGVVIDGMSTDELLARLETADRGLRTLQARVQRVRTFPGAEGGGTHIWRGELEFEQRPGDTGDPGPAAESRPARAFAVHFSREIVDGVVRERSQSYIFDGTWLLELDETTRQFVRRRVVAEGSGADPLRIGEGPLPMPIGQKAEDMRQRFHVSIAPSLEGVPEGERFRRLHQMLADCWQLRLVPRDGTEMARDFRDLRLWYRRSDLLPVFAQTANADGTRDEILLIDHRVNEPIASGRFTTQPPTGQGWSGRTEEFRGPRALPSPAPPPAGGEALKAP